MVSTRRGARSDLVDGKPLLDDPEAALRKKPSRKANASQNSTTSTASQSTIARKTRNTRSKTASQNVVEESQSDVAIEELEENAPAPSAAKVTRGSTRGRKTKAEAADDRSTATVLKGHEDARVARVAKRAQDEETSSTEDKAQPEDHTAQVQRTMRTRGKANTQASAKSEILPDIPSQSQAASKSVGSRRGKAGTRSQVKQAVILDVNDISLQEPVNAVKAKRSKRVAAKRPETPPSEPSMSTILTSPAQSPLVEFSDPKGYKEDRLDALQDGDEEDSEDELLDEVALELSEDELAGPKTPMKRGVRRKIDHRQDSSSHAKSSLAGDVEMHASEEEINDSTMFQDVIPDEEDQLQTDNTSADETGDLSNHQLQAELQDAIEDQVDAEMSATTPGYSSAPLEDVEGSLVLDTIHENQPANTLDEHILDFESQSQTVDGGSALVDPDATEIVDDVENPASPSSASDRSVIHTQLDDNQGIAHDDREDEDVEMQDVDDEADYTQLSLTVKTPGPQTIHWENIQANTVVRQNLAMQISPHVDESQLGIMPDQLSSPTKREIEAQAEHQQDDEVEQDTIEFTDFVALPTAEGHPELSSPYQQSRVNQDTGSDNGGSVDDVLSSQHISATIQQVDSSAEQKAADSPDPLEAEIPHYMNSTIAFDARRKSLPNRASQTPVKTGARPKTSDGASDHSHQSTYDEPWWLKARSTMKPPVAVPSPAHSHSRRNMAPFSAGLRSQAVTPTATPIRMRQADQARTIAVPSRYRRAVATPVKSASKPSARELLARTARSPARTPLRSLIGMGGLSSMTPHPTVPLRGVVAVVEVYTNEGASASTPFIAQLHRLGAKTTKIWGDRVTHVVYKDGPPTTLQRVLLHNKKVLETGIGTHIHCVNSRWVSDCDSHGTRVLETDEAYAVHTSDFSINRRKRKSMEPSTVVNIDGSLIKHRKNSWGRSASGRLLGSPLMPGSPRVPSGESGKENSASPATPAWLAAPGSLVQSTAPLKRVRKLESAGVQQYKRRRSFWNDS